MSTTRRDDIPGVQTLSSTGGAQLIIKAPTNKVVQIDAITAGEQRNNQEATLGVIDDTQNGDVEPEAISSSFGGQLAGPWTIDDDVGLLIEPKSSTIVCSFLGAEQ